MGGGGGGGGGWGGGDFSLGLTFCLSTSGSRLCEFSAYVAFNQATNGQTDIKHEKGKNTLLNVTVEDRS